MKLYTIKFYPISYYFQLQNSKAWSAPALFPNPVYRFSSMPQTKYHTHIYENTT